GHADHAEEGRRVRGVVGDIFPRHDLAAARAALRGGGAVLALALEGGDGPVAERAIHHSRTRLARRSNRLCIYITPADDPNDLARPRLPRASPARRGWLPPHPLSEH